jgi:hypothetical protein
MVKSYIINQHKIICTVHIHVVLNVTTRCSEVTRSNIPANITCVERLKTLRLYDTVCLLKLNKVEYSANVKTISDVWYGRNQLKAIFVHKDCGDPRGVKLTTHLQLVPRSRKCGSIHPFPHTPSWRSA